MVNVLDVVVILEHVDELLHVLDIGLVGQSDVVLGDSRNPNFLNWYGTQSKEKISPFCICTSRLVT